MYIGFALLAVLALVRVLQVSAATVILVRLPKHVRPLCPACSKNELMYEQEVRFRGCLACLSKQSHWLVVLIIVCGLVSLLLWWWERGV